jgi:hypothetical protein
VGATLRLVSGMGPHQYSQRIKIGGGLINYDDVN